MIQMQNMKKVESKSPVEYTATWSSATRALVYEPMLDLEEDHLVDHPSRIKRCTLQGQDDAALRVPTWTIWHMMERSSMRGRVRSLK